MKTLGNYLLADYLRRRGFSVAVDAIEEQMESIRARKLCFKIIVFCCAGLVICRILLFLHESFFENAIRICLPVSILYLVVSGILIRGDPQAIKVARDFLSKCAQYRRLFKRRILRIRTNVEIDRERERAKEEMVKQAGRYHAATGDLRRQNRERDRLNRMFEIAQLFFGFTQEDYESLLLQGTLYRLQIQ